jgi:hypothetical protein
MNSRESLVETICKHRAVSRAMAGKDSTRGLEFLVQLRRARRDVKRCLANMRDEIEHGITPEMGGAVAPSRPGPRLLREALCAGGLPSELRALVISALKLY